MRVLLFTHRADFYTIDLVMARLRDLGAAPIRVDTDHFPLGLQIEVVVNEHGPRVFLHGEAGTLAVHEAHAAWARRIWAGPLPANMAPEHRAWSARHGHIALFDGLAHASTYWVNDLFAQRAAESKIRQLSRAAHFGLRVPQTMITNAPQRVRAFAEHGPLCTKLLDALSQSMGADGAFVYTSVVDEAALAHIDEVRSCPQIFQPLVEKSHEIRAIVVGERVFCAGIDPNTTERGRVDWRLSEPSAHAKWFATSLPAEVERNMLALVRDLGLRYAAIDFIVEPGGAHTFLELNPAGEWGWLQRDCDLDIAGALAEELVNRGAA